MEDKKEIQVFWDTGKGERHKSWSTMHREGNKVIFECRDFDHEDNREYDYIGEFSVEDYRRAIDELQKTLVAELTEPRSALRMVLEGEIVNLRFQGTPSPCSTPGGALLFGTVPSSCEISKMLLIED
ncbi:MAG: hypothetical protein Q8N58_00955 [bacterium]|nr:hypothetical protein [bacterium]